MKQKEFVEKWNKLSKEEQGKTILAIEELLGVISDGLDPLIDLMIKFLDILAPILNQKE